LIITDSAGAHTVKSADHAAGTVGSYFTSTITLTNTTSIAGPVHVAGDFSCNSNGRIDGDLDVTGTVYLTNNCIVTGSVRAGGSAKLDSTSTIQGNLISEGDLTFQSTARIGGSIYLAGSLISSDGKSSDYLTSHGQIGGTVGEGVLLPAASHPSTADAVDSASQWPGMTVTSWAKWMNDTAGATRRRAGRRVLPRIPAARWHRGASTARLLLLLATRLSTRPAWAAPR